jgi:hypothetical protein
MKKTLIALALLSLAACKSGPEVVPEAEPPSLPEQKLEIASQSLTDCQVKLVATLQATTEPVIAEKALWEFVVEGEVRRSGEQPLSLSLAAGEKGTVELDQKLTYVKDTDDLKAMDARGGSLLVALRGDLVVKAGDRQLKVPFAQGREVRTPRLPHVKLREFEAGRFSETEVQAVFHVGVVNPNNFVLVMNGLTYQVEIAGKKVNEGKMGAGDKLSPASTGVFDLTGTINEETHGKDVKKLIKGLVLPFVLSGTMSTDLYDEPLDEKGEIKLNPPSR